MRGSAYAHSQHRSASIGGVLTDRSLRAGVVRFVPTGNGGSRSCAADGDARNGQCKLLLDHGAAVSASVWQCEFALPHAVVGASGVLGRWRCIWNAPPPQQSVVCGVCELRSSPDRTGRPVLASAVYMVWRLMLENVSVWHPFFL